MPTTYAGDADNVTLGQSRTITGADNSGVGGTIRITTSVNHLFGDGDYVQIAGVTGTTEANGTWQIAVMTATTFRLIGSTFANAYVAGGTAVDITCIPQASLLADGEAATASGLAAPVQVALDRTQLLAKRLFVAEQAIALLAGEDNVDLVGYYTAGAHSYVMDPDRGDAIVCATAVGGGGGGGGGSSNASNLASGGGGGGAGQMDVRWFLAPAGSTIDVTVGAGGAGGVEGDPSGTNGTDGDATLVQIVPTTYATGWGGGKGAAGGVWPGAIVAPGGQSRPTTVAHTINAAPPCWTPNGFGGVGANYSYTQTSLIACEGGWNGQGVGGSGGAKLAPDGGPGGGGGAGPIGTGGDGGTMNTTAPTAGTSGGGGGGGAGGPTGSAIYGPGASGGAGFAELVVIYKRVAS